MSKFKQTLKMIEEGLLKPLDAKEMAEDKERDTKRVEAKLGKRIQDIIDRAIKNSDGTYDVDGDVDLENLGLDEENFNVDTDWEDYTLKKITKLPIKFGKVSGYFSCSNNSLTTLEGSPKEVGGPFLCFNNNLKDLKGSPEKVGGFFECSMNQLTSVEGAPKEVEGDFLSSETWHKFTEEDIRKVSNVKGKIDLKSF